MERQTSFQAGEVDGSNEGVSETIRIGAAKKTGGRLGTVYFADSRFRDNANADPAQKHQVAKWRMKQRMKTVSVALVCCLNIGVDPPDVMKPSPYPFSQSSAKALEQIGKNLQQQYERWQSRSLDPTVEEVKKLCVSLRRNAKDERVLFHYNGHGVPKPTSNGEIWVFNKNYTQYIPLSIYELQTWMGSPSIYVFDCSAAGLIIQWFNHFAEQRVKERDQGSSQGVVVKDYILLAACAADQILPMNPQLPADVFTSCLTTPIKMALHWYCQHTMIKDVNTDLIDKLPGRLNDRRTALGELNWIFTAVTDTIAWNVLPKDLFQKLFRQDLLVASLFRNFLLAERIMRSANCTPLSYPALPPTFQHPMWNAWDLAADMCLAQLPDLLADPATEYQHSPFFTEQLTAFEVWLEFGSETKKPPEQLPIVLQVLLSQAHRLRALVLLARFLDLGAWAVNLALSVGIFPYVLKLLQSPAVELRQTLVFIWAKILALDKSCQLDLVKDNGHNYFLNVLASASIPSDQRTMAAFVLAAICENCRPGQSACLNGKLVSICLAQINDPDPLLRRWIALCMAKLWEGFDEAKWAALRDGAHKRLCSLLTDPAPEARAAAVYALGTFMGGASGSEQRKNVELNLAVTLPVVTADGSPMVRKELIVALSRLVFSYEAACKEVALELLQEEAKQAEQLQRDSALKKKGNKKTPLRASVSTEPESPTDEDYMSKQQSSVYGCVWKMILTLAADPFPELASMARHIVSHIHRQLQTDISTAAVPSPRTPVHHLLRRYAESPSQILGRSPMSARRTGQVSMTQSGQTPVVADRALGMRKTLSVEDLASMGPSAASSTEPTASSLPPLSSIELQSQFYDWSCEHFSRPMMKDVDDPSSPTNAVRQWRHRKHHASLAEARTTRDKKVKLDEQIAILDNETEMASLLLFHPLDPLLIATDNKDTVKVWNWVESRAESAFSNGNPPGTRISAMALVNPYDDSMLLTGTNNGVVRVWKNFADRDEGQPQMISSWTALPDMIPRVGPGMVLDWQQQTGMLMTSGDVGIVRVWNMERELAIQDMATGSDCCVTSIVSQTGNAQVLVAGCADGAIRLFDCRVPTRYSPVVVFQEHKDWIVNIGITAHDHQIVSCTLSGEVKFWDARKSISYRTFSTRTGDVTAFAVHPYAPIIASGSQGQKIHVQDFEGLELNQIRYHEGFLGQRIGPVSCLAFHPFRMYLAAGATDSILSIYTHAHNKTYYE
ncbi:regulatory-associated protein of mTOR, putative [Acanthamoeba castellanii str. Neff]|uniref:Regulatory-associated protein of mTOR, putative n=1 Tax=Acanthamoeba castellanii (strain ATCC 30010 / Neff) TaxID=1257118 RepID=L8GIL5_ACACF|nr:regulatory-associated protein of mTOR, putative [Acanthamoeba castellanii str. Neff]ELR12837.1 regulatory-associated protein of mTOR, putative [Acanthamoeba castellanii str. Neff]